MIGHGCMIGPPAASGKGIQLVGRIPIIGGSRKRAASVVPLNGLTVSGTRVYGTMSADGAGAGAVGRDGLLAVLDLGPEDKMLRFNDFAQDRLDLGLEIVAQQIGDVVDDPHAATQCPRRGTEQPRRLGVPSPRSRRLGNFQRRPTLWAGMAFSAIQV